MAQVVKWLTPTQGLTVETGASSKIGARYCVNRRGNEEIIIKRLEYYEYGNVVYQ